MGLLTLFSKTSPSVHRLPVGTMTLDRDGRVLANTVPSTYSAELLQEVSQQVLDLFGSSRRAQIPLSELAIHFASLKITAREMRGGAILFFTSNHSLSTVPKSSISSSYEHEQKS
jgi:hypothetical protein